jgi:hypothetical protein
MWCAAAPTLAPTLAPIATDSPASSSDPCTAAELSKIAACRAPSLQTEAACKAASSSSCKWCSNIGLAAGCYVVDVSVVCDTTDQISYLGNGRCPTNVPQAVAGFLGLAMGVFIGIIGAHLNARLRAFGRAVAPHRCGATCCTVLQRAFRPFPL